MSDAETIRGSGHHCACVHFDRFVCAGMRYGEKAEALGIARRAVEQDPCDCNCHDDYDEDEDEGEWR
jgi:hypothetical protein